MKATPAPAPDEAEEPILAAYMKVEAQFGPQRAIDAMVTVLLNMSIRRLGRENTARGFQQMMEFLEESR
jgi:hypothetical protein